MVNENQQRQETSGDAAALLRSEAVRAAQETNATDAPNHGNLTIHINVGGAAATGPQGAELRQRRRAAPAAAAQAALLANQQQASPVHARTIDRLPNNQQTAGGPVQHVHIQRNPNGQTIRVNNSGGRGQQVRINGQQVRINGQQVNIAQGGAANTTQSNARRINIPLRGSRGRPIRVSPGGRGQQVRIVTNGTQQQPHQQRVARVQLPPLLPQPLPYHGRHASSAGSNDESSEQHHEEGNEFKCLICFEFLQDPASCGKCASRFCFACIRRVAATANSNTPAKCPTCRCEFHINDIQRDSNLRERMQRADTVSCQYQGCNTQLPLNQVAAHEQTCLFVPVKCRYATFGCDWKGTRQALTEHEATCSLMQVSDFVQQFRQTRADHEQALSHLQTRVAASNAMMELHASLIRRLQKRNFHPGDLLDLVYTVTCTPARFIHTKDVWRSLTACRLARGFLCNVLAFLPTTLLMLRIAATGFRRGLQLDWTSHDDDNEFDVAAVVAIAIFSIFPLMITIFIKLGKNSVEWAQPNDPMEQFLKEGCAFLSCVVQSGAMPYGGRYISWLLICICSTFFPSFVLAMIELVNGISRTRPTNLLTAGRAVPVILFGLRYGLVANLLGVPACLGAVVFQSMIRKMIHKIKSERLALLFVKEDCFFTDISGRGGIGYVSLHALMFLSAACSAAQVIYPFETLYACILLLVVNYLVNSLIILGNTVATYVFEQAKENVLPNQTGVRKVCNLVGSISFATWILLLGGIVLSY